jgi:glyoxylase-like metal-dependent hydrolase (beta-lactamase superfamily II)
MPRLTEIAPGVLVATSQTMMTTTTVVAGDGGGCLVIDPALTSEDLAVLANELAGRGLAPVAGFATHPHWDHVLWSAALGDVPRYASPRAVAAARRDREDMIAKADSQAPGHDPALIGRLTPLAEGAGRIGWHGPPAQVIVHDAHAAGHAAVFLPDTGVLVAGDMTSDVEMPLLDLDQPSPLAGYRQGLEKLAAVPGVRWVVPGHGRVGDAGEFRRRIEADARYLSNLGAGLQFTDPRLAGGPLDGGHLEWLQLEHSAQLQFCQRRRVDRDSR